MNRQLCCWVVLSACVLCFITWLWKCKTRRAAKKWAKTGSSSTRIRKANTLQTDKNTSDVWFLKWAWTWAKSVFFTEWGDCKFKNIHITTWTASQMFILPEAVLGLIKPPKHPLFSNLFFLLRKIVAAGYFDSSGFVYFPVLPGVKFLSGDATERLFWDCFDRSRLP